MPSEEFGGSLSGSLKCVQRAGRGYCSSK
jgi:hypothetical protein